MILLAFALAARSRAATARVFSPAFGSGVETGATQEGSAGKSRLTATLVDVAQAALFLCSDLASQITGTLLPVDGGITAGDPVNHLKEIFDARTKALGR